LDPTAPKRSKTDGLSRRKKRLFQARTEDKKANAQQSIAAKHAKSSQKAQKLQQFKESGGKAKDSSLNKKKRGSAFQDEMKSSSKRRK
jgi:hypothetical protein